MMIKKIAQKLRHLLVHGQWHIGLIRCASPKHICKWTKPQSISWLPRAQGVYRANPAVITHDGKIAVFYEEYIFSEDRGHLACREINIADDGHITFADPMRIDGPRSHRSYPYIFEDEGVLWMIPEESSCGNIMLYRCTEFPNKWEPVKEIIQNFPGINPTIFYHNRLYWLFTTRADSPDEKLFIFHAETLEGEWSQHKKAPFYNNSTQCCPAGKPFLIDGRIYRPAQDSSQTHGDSIIIYEIDELTRHDFREHRISDITPWSRTFHGIHTISYDTTSQICAFDIKTNACLNDVLGKLWAKVMRYVRRHYVPIHFL